MTPIKKSFFDSFKEKYIYPLSVLATMGVFGLLIRMLIVVEGIKDIKDDIKEIKHVQSQQPEKYVLKSDYNEHCKEDQSAHNNLQIQIGQQRYERTVHGNNIVGQ